MNYKYTVVEISENWEIWFKAIIPSFPKLFIVADSAEELHNAVKLWIKEEIKYLKLKWKNIPKTDNLDLWQYSWNFVLRIKPELHKRLSEIAESKWWSLNKYISNLVEEKI